MQSNDSEMMSNTGNVESNNNGSTTESVVQQSDDSLKVDVQALQLQISQLTESNETYALKLQSAVETFTREKKDLEEQVEQLKAAMLLNVGHVAEKMKEEYDAAIVEQTLHLNSYANAVKALEAERSALLLENEQLSNPAALEALKQANADLTVQISTLHAEINDLQQKITDGESNTNVDAIKALEEEKNSLRLENEQLKATLNTPAPSDAQLEALKKENTELTTQISTLEKRIAVLQQSSEAKRGRISELVAGAQGHENLNNSMRIIADESHKHYAFYQIKANRLKLAEGAIDKLKAKMSNATEILPLTGADKTLQSIITILENSFKEANPQTYFDKKLPELKTHLAALQDWTSLANQVINAILTVLTVCSVVGTPLLWATGVLENNAKKNGSSFAFTMFGARQKAECDIYQATQAMDVKLGM